MNVRLNQSRIAEDHATETVAGQGEVHLGRSRQQEITAHAIVIRPGARADPAKLKSPHRSQAASVKSLKERGIADDETGVCAEREDRFSIQKVLVEGPIIGTADADLLKIKISPNPAGRLPSHVRRCPFRGK